MSDDLYDFVNQYGIALSRYTGAMRIWLDADHGPARTEALIQLRLAKHAVRGAHGSLLAAREQIRAAS